MLQYSDILRGLTDSLILAQLEYGDSYGYEISKTILKESDGSIELKEASLYTSFRRLEEAGYITSYWGDENSGARRRYYTLNDEGKVFITENKEDWKKISKIISDLLSGKKKRRKTKMSTKIRNYVEVLFSDIPRTKKSQELKEEILANVTERFNAYIAQGKTENQAYSLAVSEMGDIDEMLQSIAPDRELKPKIDAYRVKRAKNTAIAVSLYIIGVAFLILFGGLPTMLDMDILEDTGGIIGLIVLLVFSAIATAMLVYTYLAVPQDIEPYLRERQKDDYDLGRVSEQKRMLFKSVSSLLWLAITIIYLLVSFTTGAWHISWIIFLIGSFVQQSIRTFMMIDSDKE